MKITTVILFMLFMGCGSDRHPPVSEQNQMPDAESLIEKNQNAIKLENLDIDQYVQRKGLKAIRTGRGIQYQILRDREGAVGEPGQWATVNYRVELLNGDTAYSTEAGHPESFMIEMDDVESGLHEGVQLMSAGDSAVIIIPSYRAHGLSGDRNKIPMRSSVVYHIGLVKLSAAQ